MLKTHRSGRAGRCPRCTLSCWQSTPSKSTRQPESTKRV